MRGILPGFLIWSLKAIANALPDQNGRSAPSLPGLHWPRSPDRALRLCGVGAGAAPLACANLIAAYAGPCVVVVTPDPGRAEHFMREVAWLREGQDEMALLPDHETLPYDLFSPHPEIVSRRLETLARLLDAGDSATPLSLFVSASTLMDRLPPAAALRRWLKFDCRVGQTLDPQDLVRRLEDAAYVRVPLVSEAGEYAMRGALIDLYASGAAAPVRIEFFDLEVESIREFNPASQRSTRPLDSLRLLPARELPLDPQSMEAFRERFRRRFPENPARAEIYRKSGEGTATQGAENYLPLFYERTETLWDYLPADSVVIMMPGSAAALQAEWENVLERFRQRDGDPEQPCLAPEELFAPPAFHESRLSELRRVECISDPLPDLKQSAGMQSIGARPAPSLPLSRTQGPTSLAAYLEEPGRRVLLSADTAGQRELVRDLLQGQSLKPQATASWDAFLASRAPLCLTESPLGRGVALDNGLVVLTERELFGRQRPLTRRRRRGQPEPEAILQSLTDLASGAPVVHEDHGIGRYEGLATMDAGGAPAEFMRVGYAGGDRLYVPVSDMQLITRYTGGNPENAPLHRLGSDAWARIKRRAEQQVRDTAAELLQMQARRAARRMPAMRAPAVEMSAFSARFPYRLTHDQKRAVEQVLEDLAQGTPMDRLICGDVGFGKTEVALRAAFTALVEGFQVAVLAPTTLLAQQHHRLFSDRFADWPVRAELLTRFGKGRANEALRQDLKEGRVDIVVGSHGLLNPRIGFKRLGLLVVDEEHRFGVRQKERIKALRADLHVLTLTATPIPRTLNMSLGGLRDLSLITTPPPARMAVKTFVTPWRNSLIREACMRELRRGGAVFFVHNRVRDIDRVARELRNLLGEVRMEVAHGQLLDAELQRVMTDFYHRRFDVLVCTTIIESGLDIPHANTMLINRADRLGLAQLHQLRGRVGRSHHQAYAYLIRPHEKEMTADAHKRLEAIQAAGDLGAGFLLATHDLEIRGAGELLGEEQSGQIQQIGFSLYNEILNRAVEELRGGGDGRPTASPPPRADMELHLAALLPEDYMPDVNQRLNWYKRIASASGSPQLDELKVELVDRFGPMPEAARNLFRQARIQQRMRGLGIRMLEAAARGGEAEFHADTRVDPMRLVALAQRQPQEFALRPNGVLKFRAALDDSAERFRYVERLLAILEQSSISAQPVH
ncbi:MAG: transcription-repair coupling factor [Gammaproteobacteria bacterium]|nr:transcription-repair coupling factor [Gammaproteobacteria bacterium]